MHAGGCLQRKQDPSVCHRQHQKAGTHPKDDTHLTHAEVSTVRVEHHALHPLAPVHVRVHDLRGHLEQAWAVLRMCLAQRAAGAPLDRHAVVLEPHHVLAPRPAPVRRGPKYIPWKERGAFLIQMCAREGITMG